MESMETITVRAKVKGDIDKVWKMWTLPSHIIRWNHASDDWECPKSENDLRVGGKFSAIMASVDGKHSFEFGGTYTRVEEGKRIDYSMADGRKASVAFEAEGDSIVVTETFDPESENPREMQQGGWQAILDNFKKHVESN